jgi:hypothetical protein
MSGISLGVLGTTYAPPKVIAGPTAGADYAMVQNAPSTNTTISITHPAAGYFGTLQIYMCGTTSRNGSYWDAASDLTYNGTGENAFWTYTCIGDETSFTLQQLGLDGYSSGGDLTNETLKFIINGGVNDGKFLCVGSARGNTSSYGHGGACANQSGYSTLTTATRNAYGGNRYSSTTCYYSDATNYGPDQYASYGSTTTTYSIGGDASALIMGYSSVTGYGMRYRPTSGTAYSNYSTISNSGQTSASRLTSPTGFGAVVLVFKND